MTVGVAEWDGIRDQQANKYMSAMKVGDNDFVYHSADEKRIVGVLDVVKEHYPDHTYKSGKLGIADFKAFHPVETPVTLVDIKVEEC